MQKRTRHYFLVYRILALYHDDDSHDTHRLCVGYADKTSGVKTLKQ